MSSRNLDKEHFKYGICLNEDCPMCKSKEVQKVSLRKDFICSNPNCGQELRECPPPKKVNPLPFIIGSAALIIIAAIVLAIVFGKKAKVEKAEAARIAAIEQARMDSIAKVEADSIKAVQLQEAQAAEAARLEAEAAAAAEQARLAEEEAKAAKKATSGSIDYGKWSGAWKGGKPNGTGTMKYTKERLIDSRDPQKRVAKPGDYIIGEFANGKLVQGVWYDSANNVKGSIIIGM